MDPARSSGLAAKSNGTAISGPRVIIFSAGSPRRVSESADHSGVDRHGIEPERAEGARVLFGTGLNRRIEL